MADGGDKIVEAFEFGQAEYFIKVIIDIDVELAFFVEEHLIGLLNGVKVICFGVVEESVQILHRHLLTGLVIVDESEVD